MTSSSEPVLSVRDLVVEFRTPKGPLRAIDGVSFDVFPGEVLGVVGESGSGKSISMLAVMGLLPRGRSRIAGGEVIFQGRNLLELDRRQMRSLRGQELAMVFQDPMTSLNPVRKVGAQIGEAIGLHHPKLSRSQIRDRVIELLRLVGIPHPEERWRQYPHEFSGGLRQRVMIAMAISNEPALLIADEPTTALDVTIQAQVLGVLKDVREKVGASMVIISHNLGLIAEVADRVAVIYGGRVMETSGVETLFAEPRHPYTVGLMASLPRLDVSSETLYSIPGQPPQLESRPSGCVFNPRCALRQGRSLCVDEVPPLLPITPSHSAACHFSEEVPKWRAAMAAPARVVAGGAGDE